MWIPIPKGIIQNNADSLSVGTYQIIVNLKILHLNTLIANIINDHVPIIKEFAGKKYIIQGAWIENGNCGIQIQIFQNPIPILVILGACGFLLGGFVLWQVLVEVRKLLEFSGVAGKIGLGLFVIGGGVIMWKNRKKMFK